MKKMHTMVIRWTFIYNNAATHNNKINNKAWQKNNKVHDGIKDCQEENCNAKDHYNVNDNKNENRVDNENKNGNENAKGTIARFFGATDSKWWQQEFFSLYILQVIAIFWQFSYFFCSLSMCLSFSLTYIYIIIKKIQQRKAICRPFYSLDSRFNQSKNIRAQNI